jgi:hypothetical protein
MRSLPPCYLKTMELSPLPDRFWLGFHWNIFQMGLGDWKMRSLGISAIVMASCLATLSIIFIGLAYSDGWTGGSACSVAESLCRRPSLLAIPVTVAMAWGLMVLADE